MRLDVQPVIVAGGFSFPEGPSFDAAGDLYLVNIHAGTVSRMTPQGVVSTFVTTGGGPNGSKFHANGPLYVCEAGRREILAIAPDGTMRSVADNCAGQRFAGPNDMIFDATGGFYFTDPPGSDAQNPIGAIYYVSADGTVRRVAEGLAFPNGVVLSADKRTLFFGETSLQRISHCAVRPDGSLGPYETFCQLPRKELQEEEGPDGMAFGADGRLYAATYGQGCVWVISPQGETVAELPAGGLNPTNVAFWGESLYVTETQTDTVRRLDIGVRGQPLP